MYNKNGVVKVYKIVSSNKIKYQNESIIIYVFLTCIFIMLVV